MRCDRIRRARRKLPGTSGPRAKMTERGPRAQLVEFAGIGHAPALMADDQIAAIRDFLLAG